MLLRSASSCTFTLASALYAGSGLSCAPSTFFGRASVVNPFKATLNSCLDAARSGPPLALPRPGRVPPSGTGARRTCGLRILAGSSQQRAARRTACRCKTRTCVARSGRSREAAIVREGAQASEATGECLAQVRCMRHHLIQAVLSLILRCAMRVRACLARAAQAVSAPRHRCAVGAAPRAARASSSARRAQMCVPARRARTSARAGAAPASLHPALDRLNSSTKWVVSLAAFVVVVSRRDALSCWCLLGSIANSFLSRALKYAINEQRPENARKADPGMPSSHAQVRSSRRYGGRCGGWACAGAAAAARLRTHRQSS